MSYNTKKGCEQLLGRILIVSSSKKGAELFSEMLHSMSSEYYDIHIARNGAEARRTLADEEFELIIIDTPLSDEFGDELAQGCADSTYSGILMTVKSDISDEISEQAEDYGVFVIKKPLSKSFLHGAMRLALTARKRLYRLEKENTRLQSRLDEVKLADRAKCVLIQYLHMTEKQAHRYIEKQAMNMQITIKEVSLNILKTYES